MKVSRTQVHDLEAALGLHRKAGGSGGGVPRTAPLAMSYPGGRGGIGSGDLLAAQSQFQEERVNDYERMIEMQRAEMRRLRDSHDMKGGDSETCIIRLFKLQRIPVSFIPL